MRKTYCFACLLLCLLPGLRAQELLRESVYFETDQHQLRAQDYQLLDDLIQQTTSIGDFHLQILAFTDDRGASDYNQSLADRRANAVKTYLLQKGITAEKTSVQSFGEVQNILAESEERQRASHRRVDLILTAKMIESLADLMADLKQDRTQTFTLQAGPKDSKSKN
jgi:outer membrane protein OmpA-like peptidoglycan-associated protein